MGEILDSFNVHTVWSQTHYKNYFLGRAVPTPPLTERTSLGAWHARRMQDAFMTHVRVLVLRQVRVCACYDMYCVCSN